MVFIINHLPSRFNSFSWHLKYTGHYIITHKHVDSMISFLFEFFISPIFFSKIFTREQKFCHKKIRWWAHKVKSWEKTKTTILQVIWWVDSFHFYKEKIKSKDRKIFDHIRCKNWIHNSHLDDVFRSQGPNHLGYWPNAKRPYQGKVKNRI